MIQEEVDTALNPRLGTDSRLAHAITAITYLSRWACYQDEQRAMQERWSATLEERLRLLRAEVLALREGVPS